MRVTIIGTGYVGLVSGVCLAARGHQVTCVDTDPAIVNGLNKAIPHIYEQGLDDLLREVVSSGRFKATSDLPTALAETDGALIAVGTPSEHGVIDLSYVLQVAREIGLFLKTSERFLPIVVKSTVIPGTTDTVLRREIETASGKTLGAFGLGMNPEFLREGVAVDNFMNPDRIVFGYEDAKTLAFQQELYASWPCDKVAVNSRTAELTKYVSNSLLAVQISAVNEMANFAAALGGIDILEVLKGVHLDKRLNPIVDGKRVEPELLTYLIPGCGFGGSCFPKDVQALQSQGAQLGLPMAMLNAVLSVNETQALEVVAILERELGSLEGRKCLVLGLAFKPDTDDVRESASLRIVDGLLDKGVQVSAHDPIATENFKRFMGAKASAINFCADWKDAVTQAEIVIIATKWLEYAALEQCDMAGKTIFDARRLIPVEKLTNAHYLTIGRRITLE
jgi:UDPglucose 6-dehydrogenase